MKLSNPFRIGSANTPQFFLSTVFICSLEILGHLTPKSDPTVQVLVACMGFSVLLLGVDHIARQLLGSTLHASAYLCRYHAISVLSFMATAVVTYTTADHEVLYLPILVGLCFKSFGYIVRSRFIMIQGSVMLLSTLALALYHSSYMDEWDPTLFLMAYCVSIFADLLIGSLDEVHKKYTATVEDKAAAVQAVHELMMGTISSMVEDKMEDMQVLSSEEYRSSSPLFLLTLGRHTGYINQVLRSSGFSYRTRDPLQDVVSSELAKEYDLPLQATFRGMSIATDVGYHRMYLSTVIHGILDGACCIAEHNGVGTLRIDVSIGPASITLEDSSGRVPENVCFVSRRKFWRTITDPAVETIFGLRVQEEPTPVGSRYTIELTG